MVFCVLQLHSGFIGLLGGIVRTGGLLTGFVTPVIVSLLTPNVNKELSQYKSNNEV